MLTRQRGGFAAGDSVRSRPFCRGAELEKIKGHLGREDCRAIFLNAEMGMGSTSLLRQLAQSPPANAPVITLQGTPSLSDVPFGVLSPYLRHATSEFVASGVDAIRAILAVLADQEAETRASLDHGTQLGTPLLLIDEADQLDPATAEVAVRLVQSGQVKVVAAHREEKQLVEPFPQLWNDGLAERIQLRPLTRARGHKFCVDVLGGPTSEASSWHFWSAAGGNPLLMSLVMNEALDRGLLSKKGRVWVAEMASMARSNELQDVVREQLRGISAAARQTLNMVALSEPVPVGTVAGLLGRDSLRELQDRHLVIESLAAPGQLQLVNPIYGEVIRGMVPRAESVMLHRRLVGLLQSDESNPQALLRRVTWALDNGEAVPEDRLLVAGIYACKLFQSPLALRLAGLLKEPGSLLRARCIMARAHYNMGEYEAAVRLLDGIAEQAKDLPELLNGALLLSATRTALGQPPERNHQDAVAMREAGDRLASANPEQALSIRTRVYERADVLEVMNLSRTGEYRQLGELAEKFLAAPVRADDNDFWLDRAIVLAIDAERLSALGNPVSGMQQAAMALEIPQSEGHDVYFLPEMILGRVQTAALSAGDWDQVEQVLGEPNVELGPSVLTFSGSSSVVKGMMLVRQGRVREALDILLTGIDSLQLSDPQQVLGFCTAMGAYAAASLGDADTAVRLLARYAEGHGMFVVTAHERAFIAAARGRLDGGALGILLEQADKAAALGHHLEELNALALALDFDVGAVAPRLNRVAGNVEGRWAQALASFAEAVEWGTAQAAVSAGETLMEAKLYGLAAASFKHAEQWATDGNHGSVVHSARSGWVRATAAMGFSEPLEGPAVGKAKPAENVLTRREREVAELAATGLPDLDIAAALHISVRTVEGHLYRSYGKLGITTRNELSDALSPD